MTSNEGPSALRCKLAALENQSRPIGVAVSGGSDSTALLLQLHDIGIKPSPRVATVDHGLRPEAAAEADHVAKLCKNLGIQHDTLTWDGWDNQGNLQDQARRARYRLLAGWAKENGIADVMLGHTRDDNAETFLMGLTRGAGLDGLSGMRLKFTRDGVVFHRPLLDQTRASLRAFLVARNIRWIDDPSNDNEQFDRIKMRQARDVLSELGITPENLAKTITNLSSTRRDLSKEVARWAHDHVSLSGGDVSCPAAAFDGLTDEYKRRILNTALRWVTGADYPARAESVMRVIQSGRDCTLHGCNIIFGDTLRLTRESARAERATSTYQNWDNRWRLTGPKSDDLHVAALGEKGVVLCPDWRASALPRTSLLASPAIWSGDALIAAPLANFSNGWTATLVRGEEQFYSSILSH
ncbi:tRNA lysidine(34) synthetase TilS [Litoreibacter roseus]|uniref:tRNA(Ile)-lysidine synthase n=1 Tax=Litoreibacter roseus TaxID=2601869 RepID=A0A6N6JIZ3_9RHOB|nr:tRNA lysidine(34) synthetase TilS [Litoreibacter roseus]GFE65389.1 tRNA(Ile)-lysidine synthase [Litoreibacter roseus]